MATLLRIGRSFYGIALVVYGVLQIYHQDFRKVIVPPSPNWLHVAPLVNVISAALIIAGLLITGIIPAKEKYLKKVCLITGVFFFIILLFCHVPLNLFGPNSPIHLGVWVDALKELALCGGAFLMAGSYENRRNAASSSDQLQKFLQPVGRIFFCTTMILFGVSHFYYTPYVSPLVPSWFGMPVFWTYLGGIALIAAGLAIVFGTFRKQVALLLALMLLVWFFVLHIPRAISQPATDNGNEIASAFDALLFCGVALTIACNARQSAISSNVRPHSFTT